MNNKVYIDSGYKWYTYEEFIENILVQKEIYWAIVEDNEYGGYYKLERIFYMNHKFYKITSKCIEEVKETIMYITDYRGDSKVVLPECLNRIEAV